MDQLTAFCQTEYAHLMAMHGLSKIWSATKLGTIKEAGGRFTPSYDFAVRITQVVNVMLSLCPTER
jgi:hypothetical protein